MATLLGISQWENLLLTVVRSRKIVLVGRLRPGLFVHGGGGGGYTSVWVTGRLICTTAFSFWVKLLALQFSHIHMCTAQQETWTDLHHLCVAETVLAVSCCWLMFMTLIFRHRDLLILKIISVQAHRNRERERECVCMCLVCVLHKLIILSKFVTEKEKEKKKQTKKPTTLTLQQNNCICCFIKFLCYFDLSENDSMRIWMCEW